MTWSLESAFVRACSAVAGWVQGVLDFGAGLEQLTRPPRQTFADDDDPHTPESHECANCGRVSPKCKPVNTWIGERFYCPKCPPYPHDGADQLAEREAEEEVSELCQCAACRGYRHFYDINRHFYDINRHFSSVREDKQQVHPADPHKTSAVGSAPGPAEHPAGADTSFPPEVPPAGPDLATWLEPAVWTALEPHEPEIVYYNLPGCNAGIYCCGECFTDWQEWREHVGKPIAAHIAKAVEADWLPIPVEPRPDADLSLLCRNASEGINRWIDGYQCHDLTYWESVRDPLLGNAIEIKPQQ